MRLSIRHLESIGHVASIGSLVASLLSITVSHILLGIAIVTTFRQWKSARYPKGAWLLVAFFLLTLLSVVAANDIRTAWPYLRKFFVLLLVPCIAATFAGPAYARRTFLTIAALGVSSATLGIAQYFSKYLAAARSGQDFVEAYTGSRITGFMSHWSTFSEGIMIAFLLIGAYLLFTPRRLWPLVMATLIGVAILLAETRGVWFAVLGGVLYLVWCWRPRYVVAVPIAVVITFVASPRAVQERAISILRPRGDLDSNAHRIALLRTGVRMVVAHPILGLGPGNTLRRFDHYAPADIARPFPKTWYLGHLHNTYVQYAAERGVPAMASLVAFILWTCWRTARWARFSGQHSWLGHAVVAALIGVLIAGCFEHNLGDSETLQLSLGLLTIGGLLADYGSTPPSLKDHTAPKAIAP